MWLRIGGSGADAGRLRLDDGRVIDAEAATYLPPVSPSKIIAVHISQLAQRGDAQQEQAHRVAHLPGQY